MGRNLAVKDSSPTPTPAASQAGCPQVTRLGSKAGRDQAISSSEGWREGTGTDCSPREHGFWDSRPISREKGRWRGKSLWIPL